MGSGSQKTPFRGLPQQGGATRKRLCPQWLLVNSPAFGGQSVSLIIPVEWITEDTVKTPSPAVGGQSVSLTIPVQRITEDTIQRPSSTKEEQPGRGSVPNG